ncbi:MAG: hypothetical protein JKY45_07855 [Emcibacter sp.]|nr:hypothetical protein [Emcibacter sp.]
MDNIFGEIENLINVPPVVVGINGLDCAGKTNLANALYKDLLRRDIDAALLHTDDYNNGDLQKIVYEAQEKGVLTEDLLNLYYNDSIHYDRAVEAVIESRKKVDVTIIEGVFLFKECLRSLLDIKVFLYVDPEEAQARYVMRKKKVGDNRPLSVFKDIWLPSFERYCREEKPEILCEVYMSSRWICRPSNRK